MKSARRVETLLDSASRLGTFMSKSICLAKKKLSRCAPNFWFRQYIDGT